MRFSQSTVEALGWYVYLLSDPRTGSVFYVGKGSDNRAFAHGAEARDRADYPKLQKAKHERILDIEAAGHEVTIEILRHALADESAAYMVEAAAIDLLARTQPGGLLNLAAGHHSGTHGLRDATELEIKYAALPCPNPGAPVILTSLDQTWYYGMSQADLLDYTCHWWQLGLKPRIKPEFVLGVHRQIVRSAYKITGKVPRQQGDRNWQDDKPGKPRHGFTVVPAPELAPLIGTSVQQLLGNATRWSIRYFTPAHFAAIGAPPLPSSAAHG